MIFLKKNPSFKITRKSGHRCASLTCITWNSCINCITCITCITYTTEISHKLISWDIIDLAGILATPTNFMRCHWLSFIVSDNHWLKLALIDSHWLSLIIIDYLKIRKHHLFTDRLTDNLRWRDTSASKNPSQCWKQTSHAQVLKMKLGGQKLERKDWCVEKFSSTSKLSTDRKHEMFNW